MPSPWSCWARVAIVWVVEGSLLGAAVGPPPPSAIPWVAMIRIKDTPTPPPPTRLALLSLPLFSLSFFPPPCLSSPTLHITP